MYFTCELFVVPLLKATIHYSVISTNPCNSGNSIFSLLFHLNLDLKLKKSCMKYISIKTIVVSLLCGFLYHLIRSFGFTLINLDFISCLLCHLLY
jgi:hypothetical protein